MLLCFSVTISVIVAELVCRQLYSDLSPHHRGRMWVDRQLQQAGTPNRNPPRVIPHPYALFGHNPEFRVLGEINSLGCRGHEPYNDGRPVVLCLGGSTTFSSQVSQPNQTWPARLEGLLGRTDVQNAGIEYSTSAEWLHWYVHRYRYLQPKLVVVHCGLNDAFPAMCPNYDPEYTHWRQGWHTSPTCGVRPGERTLLEWSGCARLAYAKWMSNESPPVAECRTVWYSVQPPEEALQRARDTEPVGFRRNMELLIRTVQFDGAKVLLVRVPIASKECVRKAVNDMSRTPDVRELCARDLVVYDAIQAGREHLWETMQELGKQCGVPVMDIDMDDKYFIDWCHVRDGDKLKAEVIAEAIRKHDLLALPQVTTPQVTTAKEAAQ
jgi:hypothetical protein